MGPAAGAGLFTWNDVDANFSACTSWVPPMLILCYPDDACDDALIDTIHAITLTEDLTIDDLTVAGRDIGVQTVFDTDAGVARTLTCDSITIDGAIVSLDGEAALVANGPQPSCGP